VCVCVSKTDALFERPFDFYIIDARFTSEDGLWEHLFAAIGSTPWITHTACRSTVYYTPDRLQKILLWFYRRACFCVCACVCAVKNSPVPALTYRAKRVRLGNRFTTYHYATLRLRRNYSTLSLNPRATAGTHTPSHPRAGYTHAAVNGPRTRFCATVATPAQTLRSYSFETYVSSFFLFLSDTFSFRVHNINRAVPATLLAAVLWGRGIFRPWRSFFFRQFWDCLRVSRSRVYITAV